MVRVCHITSLILALTLLVTASYIVGTTAYSVYNIIYLTAALLASAYLGIRFFRKKDLLERDGSVQLNEIAYTDALTSLLNRRAVELFINKMIARHKRGALKFAVLYLDMDNFKTINDTLGHDAGDQVLIEVARRLKKLIRENDAVGRLGGDEFVILLDAINESEQAAIMADRVIASFLEPLNIEGQSVLMSFSIGISIYPDNGNYRLSLFKAADIAMYQAKEKGKNCYKFYTEELDNQVKENHAMDIALKKALEQKEFTLVYQPRINLTNSAIKEAEALIRWNRPGHGIVLPSTFLPRAEKSALIIRIGSWVIAEACAQCKIYCDRGMPTQISINISLAQLKDPDFVAIVKEAIVSKKIDPALIELEMAESYLMQESESLIPILQQLRSLGVNLAVDGFGKGYSSMGYMKRLPLNKIKIDRSLINETIINQKDAELVSAMIALGHVLDLSVVAEGVEIAKHLEISKRLRIDSAQGYFLAEPLQAVELFNFYKMSEEEVS